MKKLFWGVTTLLLILASCSRQAKFTVEGVIANAEGETLVLEQASDDRTIALDSIKLNAEGKFQFRQPRPEYAEFYRLKLGSQSILFAVDSCETIEINGQKEKFATTYDIANSTASKQIKQLRNSGFELQRLANNAHDGAQNKDEFLHKLEGHKAMARRIVLADTKSLAAYYAVNQIINNVYIFSPFNKSDRSYWGAVATAYQVFMRENPRTERIKNIVLYALAVEKNTNSAIEKIGAIDITLPNRYGDNISLSSLKGNVVLIDFSAYALEKSAVHTLFLRELYDMYHADGFEIYQIALDENKPLWLEQTRSLPWVCVRDKNAPNCRYVLDYNVQEIPAWFLVDRNGDIVAGKDLDAKNLQSSIERFLRK